LTVRRGGVLPTPRQYWDIPFEPGAPLTPLAAQEELILRLRDAVNVRLIAEVPLGAFLSGGVDSSAVVAMMAAASDGPVNTCSISFADPAFDEARFAQQVADRYRTRHFVEQVESDDFDLIDELARLYDEPYADWAPRVLRAKSTFQALGRGSIDAYFHSMSVMRGPMRAQLFSDSFKRRLGGYDAVEVFRRHGEQANTDDPLALIQYLDMKTY